MSYDVNCPYCNYPQDIDHEDGYGLEEDMYYRQACCSCSKTFLFSTSVVLHYKVDRADCLNDGKHQWEPIPIAPKCMTKMQCKVCGTRRTPTEQERTDLQIPSIEQYIKELNNQKE